MIIAKKTITAFILLGLHKFETQYLKEGKVISEL